MTHLRPITFLILILMTLHAWADRSPSYATTNLQVRIEAWPNGTFALNQFTCLRVTTPQEIDAISRRIINFNGALDTLTVLEAYTLTPTGKRIDLSPEAIKTQASAQENYGFSSNMQTILIFPEVTLNSQICYRRETLKHTPIVAGHLSIEYFLDPDEVMEKANIELIVHDPRVTVFARGLTGGPVPTKNGVRRYQYQHSIPEQPEIDHDAPSMDEAAPGLRLSSFKNYAAIASAYQKDAAPMAAITPEIQALADEITQGKGTLHEQVKALYHWTIKNIRYVAIHIGRGGWVPHSAASVLKNRYGDCKDKALLLEALLKAKGIESSAVLIQTDDLYTLPETPVLTAFDHVITYIPALNLYIDGTANFVPMGTLTRSMMDKPVLHVATGQLRRIPTTTHKDNLIDTTNTLKVTKDGYYKGTTLMRKRGHFESASRSSQFKNKAEPQEAIVNDLLHRTNETGTGTITPPDPEDLDVAWDVKSSYVLDPVSNVPGYGAFTLPIGLSSADLFIRASKRPRSAPYKYGGVCIPETIRDRYSIHFPDNIKITRIPAGVYFKEGKFSYHSSYKLIGDTLIAERTLKNTGTTVHCTAADYEIRRRLHKVLQRDMRGQVFYE
jgi:hypothetical protein